MADAYLVKIVRDGLAKELGCGTVSYEPVDRATHIYGLRKKLVEEALEYTYDPCIAELADTLDVVRSLADVDLYTSMSEIESAWDDQAPERQAHISDLRKRLVEGAVGYALAPGISELAAVLAVIKSLAAADLDASMRDIEYAAQAKTQKRGGFTVGTGMFVTHTVRHAE
jgi:predicted house-cleaning noncanonical NTP pyrophosphatase (MazG superfamily)